MTERLAISSGLHSIKGPDVYILIEFYPTCLNPVLVTNLKVLTDIAYIFEN